MRLPLPVPLARLRHPILALLLASAALLAVAARPASASVPGTPSGWTLIWADDFNGPAGSLPSSSDWIIDTGHSYPGGPDRWGTGEIQRYTADPANVSLDGNGNLRITPIRTASGEWTSARIETRRADFKPAPGRILRIEGRIQLPNVTGNAALGYWPAFWALGSPYRGNYWNWPEIGEFDIMENVNGLNTVWGVLHCGVNPGGPCNEPNGIGNSRACPGSTCQSGFHTYRFEWDTSVSPNQLRWYVDGQLYHTVSQNQLDATTWSKMTSHSGYFLLLNVAMGGAFPDGVAGFPTPTSATVSGKPMLVDYVAVWQSGSGSSPSPSPSPSTSPQPGGFDARSIIQAEHYSAQSGTQLEPCSDEGGGQNVGYIANGDWLRFDNVDFGSTPVTQFKARVASGAPEGISGLVQVRLDSLTAPPIGDFAIANTGGWQSWRTVPANISPVTGKHTVYITFSSGQPADFVNLNWFTFE
ncbi:glycoside hydrolase family 16 protein [Thermobispora bispora]|uniref:Carbohydrate binding family 6 n=1 Tax=Thermobispora bispora (strain ATCC 19993 / DSM 43833 / CBS 139.67 / JCM 10125 / KCTC 9307 / NBRC 14880 / R51) TaxID=469371 RepID=D6Y6J5_THEBD|nr:glycoside hydrolase family 16 protein [Thermobispora bispora]ADG87567.1 Carbohydrate binding family 6 [Thermobispora bispora DSM 43833]